MKTSVRISTCLLILLLVVLSASAQQTEATDSASIRSKIEELEKTDIKSKSKTVQDIYKQTLARLYQEYIAALRQDVSDLKKIQSVAQSDPQREIASAIEKLSTEMNITAEKLKTIQGGDIPASTSASGSSTSASETVRAPETSPTATVDDSARSSLLRPGVLSDGSNFKAAPAVTSITASSASVPVFATVTLCGQIKPASLIEIWSKVFSSPNLTT